jgi:asparagine synthase (glutamine-hydrolysing)
MCGIAGAAWNRDAEPLGGETLRRMAAAIAHRGPDGEGFHQAPGVALAHRRLAIIDVAGGHQPLSNEDGTVWIAFNGEIYNYKELLADLRTRHQFRTASDTEVIVHLYEEQGDACLRQLRGMFALAIWDARKQRLLLARDRLGQKPLVYRTEPGRVLFASEAKALLQVPGVPRELDSAALLDYLTYQYVPRPRTIYQGLSKLAPGWQAVFENGTLTAKPYWTPDFNAEESLPYDQQCRRLRQTLAEATRLQLRSDVPLGAFLSGGIDSTVVVGLMAEALDRPVRTFSIGFAEKEFDETEFARAAALHLKTEHHELRATPDALALLPTIAWHYDEPFADSSAIPTLLVSQMTREHVTVALTGDAGDELFGGYERFGTYAQTCRFDRLPWPLPAALRSKAWDWLPGHRQDSVFRKIKNRLALLREEPRRRYLNWVRGLAPGKLAGLLTPEFANATAGHDPAAPLIAAFDQCRQRDPLTQATIVDMLTYLPDCLLAKVDIASMAYALECRSPFLDHVVVEEALKLPAAAKVQGNVRKRILIDSCRDLLPDSIQKRGKMGFRVPLDRWFRGELRTVVNDTLRSAAARTRGELDPLAVAALLDEHDRGDWNHGDTLWTLLILEEWRRKFMDGPVPTGPAPQAGVVS